MDAGFHEAALGRMQRYSLWLGIAGSLVALAWLGWRSGAGFVLGAALSYGNFRLWVRMVDALGQAASGGNPPRPRGAVFLGLRYLLLAAVVYGILKVSEVSVPALLAGLLVSVAAVLGELVYQLIFFRN